ncbi:hypothetical protein CK203_018813 [Vitis vinifera]|uniref:Uncharacterized protein n=1 Tax=Vitis vinifera TaxID=29760 RepID=A0A438JAU6_VITVI|nr:hypothetical protein CK203_018813 [Vitis vinifera]
MPHVKLSLAPQFHHLFLWPPTARRHVAPWEPSTCKESYPAEMQRNEPQMGVYNRAEGDPHRKEDRWRLVSHWKQQKVRAIASSSWLCHVFYSLLSPLLIIFIQRRETGPSTISIPLTPLFTHEPSSELNHNLAFRPLTRVHHFKYGRKSSPLIETALFPHKFDVYFN